MYVGHVFKEEKRIILLNQSKIISIKQLYNNQLTRLNVKCYWS